MKKTIYFRWCIKFLEHFAKEIRLQCNFDQTSVISICGNFDIDDKLCPYSSLSLEKSFILLGFQIDSRLNKLNNNYEKSVMKKSMKLVGDGPGTNYL